MFQYKKILKAILFSLTIIIISACGLLAPKDDSPEIVSFQKGELVSKIRHNLKKVTEASVKVAEESQFSIKSNRADSFSAVLKCEDAQQRKIDIVLENESENLTKIRIRVGLLGDAELSTKVFEQIRKKSNNR